MKSNSNEARRQGRRGKKPGKPRAKSPVSPQIGSVLNALVKHQQDIHKVVMASRPKAGGGAFSNLGGDVDSMIEHGQEAWASVKRLLNTESKANFYSLTTAGLVPSRTWNNVDLTAAIAQGVQDNQREGDSVKLLELEFTYHVDKIDKNALNETFRLVIIQSVDEAVTVADIFVDDATILSPYSQYQWDTRKQYRVLHDEVHELHANAFESTLMFGMGVTRRLRIRLNNHTQYFNNSTTVDKGAIQWLCCSSQSVSDCILFVNSKLVYVDN